MKFVLALTIVIVAVSGALGAIDRRCLDCICQVESNCNVNIGCIMDAGSLSCGPYQIKNPYWLDCGSPGGAWQTCTNSKSCSETCVDAYLRRYVDNRPSTTTGCSPTPGCRDYARVHNGGPTGCTKTATIAYADKVMACYNSGK